MVFANVNFTIKCLVNSATSNILSKERISKTLKHDLKALFLFLFFPKRLCYMLLKHLHPSEARGEVLGQRAEWEAEGRRQSAARGLCCDVDSDSVFPQWDLPEEASHNTVSVSAPDSIALNGSSWQPLGFRWT